MCMSLEFVNGGGRGEKRINSIPSKYHTLWMLLIFLQGVRGWERRKEQRQGGGRWGRYQLERWTPYHPFQSCWLAMDLVSMHCSYALTYTLHTHALTHTHILTHKHYTPAVATRGASWASWCVNFSPLSSARERLLLRGKLLLGKGWQKHFSFGLAKYSAGIVYVEELIMVAQCLQTTSF